MEFIRHYLAVLREKGLRWQLNVAWKAAAMVGALTLGLMQPARSAQLTWNDASGIQDKAHR
jgi:hypothetical protein